MAELIAGRYELHEQIGTGGVGAVWRALDRKRGEWVAVKVLTQAEAGSMLRFVREQSLRVRHPHVVAPQGFAADDDLVALSMDLVRGGSVATLLGDHGPLPEPYVAVLLDQVLDALTAIHGAGVVHRDLKPANLLLEPTADGRPFVRVCDFGVAAVVGQPRLTARGTTVGTAGYLAPEQLAGADPDPRSDLYAVGVIGRQLLTGQPPAQSLSTGPPVQPPSAIPVDGIPAETEARLTSVLRALSAENPLDRVQSASEARAMLAPLVPHGAPWAGAADAPYVFEQVAGGPAPEPMTERIATPATGSQVAVALPKPKPNPKPTPSPHPTPDPHPALPQAARPDDPAGKRLRTVMTASFALAAILLVVLLVLLIG
ncbi:serine/threonine protein kinase [Flexivirga sp. ID2601S]|uniref:Serine/threonine protein kinase n=1 Tax=Flexivirga aerilata TaxID=1656889 RepID=A0A849AFL4_9MICO|nr:serine/threonine-protein kinase [Flexivirga aerilata]NNG38667.1 serine/threonine protein kinase [Flexivirga aerilata]